MDVMEKLVELIDSARYWGCGTSEEIAKNLIENGVTVQDWIPVTERTPENLGMYLVIETHWLDGSPVRKIAKWNTIDWFTADRKSKEITPRVTHWMPLPQPPKGE